MIVLIVILIYHLTVNLSLQDTEDLFNFVPRESNIVQKQGIKTLGLETASRKRTRSEQTIYSYIKKPVKRGSKIIKIEIYDSEQFLKAEDSICSCTAEVCVQHVVRSMIIDDIYNAVKDVINKIQDEFITESNSM